MPLLFARKYKTYAEAIAVKELLVELKYADSIHAVFIPQTEEFLVTASNFAEASLVEMSN